MKSVTYFEVDPRELDSRPSVKDRTQGSWKGKLAKPQYRKRDKQKPNSERRNRGPRNKAKAPWQPPDGNTPKPDTCEGSQAGSLTPPPSRSSSGVGAAHETPQDALRCVAQSAAKTVCKSLAFSGREDGNEKPGDLTIEEQNQFCYDLLGRRGEDWFARGGY